MNILKKYNKDDNLSKLEAGCFLVLSVFLRAFIELIPTILVVTVAIIDKGSWDASFIKSSDFALSMIFFNVVSLVEIEERGSSKIDIDFVMFQRYMCILFALIFTVIYVFAYKNLYLALTNEIIIGLSTLSFLWWVILKFKYGRRKYFEEITNKQSTKTILKLK